MSHSIQTGQLTVNAAFLKEIKEDNLHLKCLWDQLKQYLTHAEVTMNHWTELTELLATLRDQLAFHFSLEEAYGYIDQAVNVSPELCLAVSQLRQDHGTLFEWIRDLSERALETDYEPDAVTRFVVQLQRFVAAFQEHEEAELRIILSTLGDT